MLFLLRRCYHVRKPRVVTPNIQSLMNYKKQLRDARRQVHIEAKEYQNKIEDEYLSRHMQQMRDKHFERQCSFRKACFVNAFRVFENEKRWRKDNELFDGKLNKYLHDEDMRKINRSRILKIMEHESNNFWFNSQNVDQRLKEQTIFPEYIASTEYYYRLFAEALAYQLGDFEQLHQVTSNEEIIKEKNKYLIPLYLQLRKQIADFKRDQIKEEERRSSFQIQRINKSGKWTGEQLHQIIAEEKRKFDQNIKKIKEKTATEAQRLMLFKQKVRDIVGILKTWKEYTNVLSLTSAQIISNQYGNQEEISIRRTEKEVINQLKSKSSQTFMSSIEEDTEEYEISFEEYLNRINLNKKESQVSGEENINIDQLNQLIDQLKTDQGQKVGQARLEATGQDQMTSPQQMQDTLDIANLLKSAIPESQEQAKSGVASSESLISEVNPEFLNLKETTSSVQALKQMFKEDVDFLRVLNQLGQIDVRYSKLFKNVWQTIHSN